MSADDLEYALYPRSVAVVGASENPTSPGYNYLRHLIDYGFSGSIYPVNPNQSNVQGLKAYAAIGEIPGQVDLAIFCIPAERVLDVLCGCGAGQVKVVHLFTARMSETGQREAVRLEQAILEAARTRGIRLLGPNCMGVYHPAVGLSFCYDFPREPGSLGMLSQSGGLATEFVRYAALNGVRFSKLISYGNGIDYDECDLLEYLRKDPETRVIACYLEGVKDGRKFLKTLKSTASTKPVILLKVGRTDAGTKAVASHTAAMAGAPQTWKAVIRQAGAIEVDTLEALCQMVLPFCLLPPITGTKVGIAGGSGGTCALAADIWREEGFDIVPLPERIRTEIRRLTPPIWWDWIGNPVDVSIIPTLSLRRDIFRLMVNCPEFDLVVGNITVSSPRERREFTATVTGEVEEIIKVSKERDKPMAVVLNTGSLTHREFEDWRWHLIAELKSRIVEAGVPVYPCASQAASALYRAVQYYSGNSIGTGGEKSPGLQTNLNGHWASKGKKR